jgi:RNA polymerase II subunit A small phosphatase-like protein
VTATQGTGTTLDSQGRPARKRSLLDGQQTFSVSGAGDGTRTISAGDNNTSPAVPSAVRRNSAGRRRTGSAGSGARATRAQHAPGAQSSQSTPTTDRSTAKSKKKGVARFLALLTCCGGQPAEENADEATQEASKRIQKPRPTQPMQAMASGRPDESQVGTTATESKDNLPAGSEANYNDTTTSTEKPTTLPPLTSQQNARSAPLANQEFNEKTISAAPVDAVQSTQRNVDKSLPPPPAAGARAPAPRLFRSESERHAAQVAAWPPVPLVSEEPLSEEDEEEAINDRTPEQARIDEDLEHNEAQPHVPIAPNELAPTTPPPEIRRQSTGRPGLSRGEASSIVSSAPQPAVPATERQIQASPLAAARHEEVSTVPAVPQIKALLPAMRPEHKGRKCLVLDLDETLVHSSFKVGFVISS